MRPPIPWLRIFVEGVVIVGSILLAFGLEAWWDDRGERGLAQSELRQVREELRQNRDQLDSRITRLSQVEVMLTELRDDIRSRELGSPIVVVDTVLASLVFAPTHNPSTAAITQLLSSGRLSLLDDADLRNELSRWPGLWDDVQERQGETTGIVEDRVLPFFVAQDVDIGRSIELTQPWIRGLADSSALSGTTTIRISGGLGSIMGERLRALRLLIRYLVDFRTFEDELGTMIEDALH